MSRRQAEFCLLSLVWSLYGMARISDTKRARKAANQPE
jgi:hypothetical protein